uniref:Uncharacterized protein n=1 Tax=Arundo donax TaxID=35708 RepID=A0A0A8ZLX1_ARUDO
MNSITLTRATTMTWRIP